MGIYRKRWDYLKVGVGLLLLAGVVGPAIARAQMSVYAEGTATNLNGNTGTDYLYGGTAGLLYDAKSLGKHLVLSGDLQIGVVEQNGERLISAVVGPRATCRFERFGLSPYVEFQIGFGRYRASTLPGALNTSDGLYGVDAGVAKRLTSRLDVIADYKFTPYGASNNQYEPMTYSAGVLFHLTKR